MGSGGDLPGFFITVEEETAQLVEAYKKELRLLALTDAPSSSSDGADNTGLTGVESSADQPTVFEERTDLSASKYAHPVLGSLGRPVKPDPRTLHRGLAQEL